MKNYFLFLSFFLLFSNCSTPDPEANKEEAMKAITGFYDAMKAFDYEAMSSFCTDGFYLIDNGKIFNNLDEFNSMIKTYEGASMEFSLNLLKANMDAESALIILDFGAVVKMGEELLNIKAIENYVLKKETGKWLIDFVQSTPLIKIDNINYKSVHLLKVPENFSVSDLEKTLEKINTVIADIGYPECGYAIYKVQSDNKENYTHVFEGKWLNEDNYNTIHENPKYKEIIEKYESGFAEIFAGQTSLRVGK